MSPDLFAICNVEATKDFLILKSVELNYLIAFDNRPCIAAADLNTPDLLWTILKPIAKKLIVLCGPATRWTEDLRPVTRHENSWGENQCEDYPRVSRHD